MSRNILLKKISPKIALYFVVLTALALPSATLLLDKSYSRAYVMEEKLRVLSRVDDLTVLQKKINKAGGNVNIQNEVSSILRLIENKEYDGAYVQISLLISKIHQEKLRLVLDKKRDSVLGEIKEKQLALHSGEGQILTQKAETGKHEVLGARVEVEVETFGYSTEGKAIKGKVFGTGSEAILLFGAIHGHEKGTKALLDTYIDELKANPSLVGSNKKIIVIPLLNPDGYHKGLWKVNANNVNLNLNFDTTDWKQYGGDANLFAGSEPFTESESKVIRDVVAKYDVKKMIAVHARGNLVNPEYGHGPSEDLAKWYANASGYRYMNDPSWFYHGTATRWFVEKYNRPAITIELPDYESSDWGKNKKALLELIK